MLYIIFHSLRSTLLPTVMLDTGLALITVFIPLVFFLLQDTHDELDRVVILKKVIQVERTFLGFCLMFAPMFLWSISILRVFLFLIFASGIWISIDVLITSYRWLRTLESGNIFDETNYRNQLRNQYLAGEGDWSEKERIWSQIWKKESTNETTFDERSLISKFTGNLNTLLQNDDTDTFARYLRVFTDNIEKRVMYDWPIYEDFFKAVLDWRFILYEKTEAPTATPEIIANHLFQAEYAVSSLLQKLVSSAFDKGPAILLFENLKKHLGGKPIEYAERILLRSVIPLMFEKVLSSPERYDIWSRYFPPEWFVTKENLQDPENLIPRIWFKAFLDWMQKRIWSQSEEDFDLPLDDLAEELFPGTDPIWWARILIFLFSSWKNNERMKSLVETKKSFGFTSRAAISSYGSIDEASENLHRQIAANREVTIDLALSVFGNAFTKESLLSYVRDLEGLNLKKDSKEDLVRREYLEIFESMLKKLGEREKPGEV